MYLALVFWSKAENEAVQEERRGEPYYPIRECFKLGEVVSNRASLG